MRAFSEAIGKKGIFRGTATIAADAATIDAARVAAEPGHSGCPAAARGWWCSPTGPISGRAGFRLIDEGNLVSAGQQTGIVSIAQLQPIAVIFTERNMYTGSTRSWRKAQWP